MVGNIKKFFTEVSVELKKVSWSTKAELIDSAWVVVLSSVFLGVAIWAIDSVISRFIGMVIK